MSRELSDEEIIAGCVQKDRTAQKTLFEKYAPRMMAVCVRYCKSQDEAKDMLQEGFIKVFDRIDTFNGESALPTWMSSVFVRICLNSFREGRKKYPHVTAEDVAFKLEADNSTHEEGVSAEKALQLVNLLPEKYKLVIQMYAVDKMGHKEIASILGITEGSSKSRLSRGRVLLKKILEDYNIER